MDEGGLPGARHPGDDGEGPERKARVDALEVVGRRAPHVQEEAAAATAPSRDRDAEITAQVLGGQAPRLALERVRRALVNDLPALLAGARPQVDHVVRCGQDGLVVLHHDHGVPLIAQRLQDADEPVRVAGVQPDRGLVEDEQGPDEPRSEGGREGDPLRLAPREVDEARSSPR